MIGAAIGNAIERNHSQHTGMEYVVTTSNGTLLTIVQVAEPPLQVGDSVLVLYGSPSRLIKAP